MAIKGSLKEASLPDVLQLLSMGKKTGCLIVTHRNNFGYIYFDKGKISYASIVNRRDRIGRRQIGGIGLAEADQLVDNLLRLRILTRLQIGVCHVIHRMDGFLVEAALTKALLHVF